MKSKTHFKPTDFQVFTYKINSYKRNTQKYIINNYHHSGASEQHVAEHALAINIKGVPMQ